MENRYSQLAESLADVLKLAQPPVAVCFTDSVPASVPPHSGKVPAGCRFWQDAATSTFATSAADHALCAIGVYTHNLEPAPAQRIDLMDALGVFNDLGYVTPQDLPLIPVLGTQPKHVIYAPLAQSPLEPDVVLLLVDASQALILSEAVQQVEHQSAPAMGRPACAVIPQVMNTGRAALSLGCCGARAYLDVFSDNVAFFALPGAKLAAYVERIVALARANSVLAKFHQLRLRDVAAGATPTIKESLAAMSS
jgi:uncharacterized protein (DUF169 family)